VRFDHVFDLALDCLQSQLGEVTDRSSGWAAIPVAFVHGTPFSQQAVDHHGIGPFSGHNFASRTILAAAVAIFLPASALDFLVDLRSDKAS